MSDAGDPPGDEAVTGITLTLDDEAATFLPEEEVLTTGSFRPTDVGEGFFDDFPGPAPTPTGNTALSIFDGANPDGQWQLFVFDNGFQDTGALAGGWALEITAKSKSRKRH